MGVKTGKPRGRPKGSQNKHTKDMKEHIYRAFHELGGKDYLVKVGKDDPKAFLALAAKVIPAELHVSGQVMIDLGQQMIQAEQRLSDMRNANVIDVTPDTAKPLITNETGDDE